MDYIEFIRNRITQLRLQRGISEYQMSYDLGRSRGFVQNITSGKSQPSLEGLLSIIDYFGLTPMQFFDDSAENPALIAEAVKGLRKLDDADKLLILNNINRLTER